MSPAKAVGLSFVSLVFLLLFFNGAFTRSPWLLYTGSFPADAARGICLLASAVVAFIWWKLWVWKEN